MAGLFGICLWHFLVVSESVAVESIDFVRDVRPIFEAHCYSCHGPEKQKSGLRLDVKSAAFRGGEGYGAAILVENPKASPILEWVASDDAEHRMPPDGEPLAEQQIEIIQRWIEQGAPWPDGIDAAELKDPREHWSFQPLHTFEGDHSVDAWIERSLRVEGLTMAPSVDRMQWLRRVTLDLHGLPPSLQEIEAFALDPFDEAFEDVVDALLASPRYGERWAQHWLDVVRYADTHGFEVNTERPNAWHYRDYVIDALNRDTPYDQFLREQIAGDQLDRDAATGFLITASVLLPGQIGADEPSKRLARQDALDEIVVNIGQTFLGLSMGCARCHDHKFDPITQREYYAMQAFVAGVEYGERELQTSDAMEKKKAAQDLAARLIEIDSELARLEPLARLDDSPLRRVRIQPKQNTERIPPTPAKQLRFSILATNSLEPCIDELEVFDDKGINIALATAGAVVASSGDNVSPDRHELRFVNDGQYGNSRSWMSNEVGKGVLTIDFPEVHAVERIVWGRDRQGQFSDRLATEVRIEIAGEDGIWTTIATSMDRVPYDSNATQDPAIPSSVEGLSPEESQRRDSLLRDRTQLESQRNALIASQMAFAGVFRKPDEIHVLYRGDPEQPKDPVSPCVPAFLGGLDLAPDTSEQDRRLALANWIASPNHPLTARVMVNRVWQGHFGVGLVATPNDFGMNGLPPSHPELLDWLAQELIRSGWSLKNLHKKIVLSDAYRQASVNPVDASHVDASHLDSDNRLLWKFPRRRLEAEVIRDSMLAVSGCLDFKMHGRGYDLFDQRGGLSGFKPVESFTGDGLRRMIYAHKVRRERDAIFGAFDCPDAGQSTALRRASTTPIQALNLFNSRFTLEQSQAFADRVRSLAGADPEQQIRTAYRLTLSREPTADEINDALPVLAKHPLEVLCRVLFNCNEFLFFP